MSATVSAFSRGGSTTTVVGEITRELVNASDGQGLHFDGAAGNIDIDSPPDLGTKFSFEFILQADSWSDSRLDKFLVDFYGSGGKRFLLKEDKASATGNMSIYSSGAAYDLGVSVLGDLGVHHLVLTIDGTAALLYDNGNQVGEATIGTLTIDECTKVALGNYSVTPSATYGFDGLILRARFWNKTLSAAEVTASFENSTVPFADQYGSQTVLISVVTGLDGWDAYTNWYSQTTSGSDMALAASAADQSCRTAVTLTAGKRYRCTYTATGVTGAPAFKYDVSGVWTALTADVGSSTITAGTNTLEFVWPAASTNDYFYILSDSTSTAVTLNNLSVVRAGCVADYDLAFANPTQSTMVQDRAGAADGTSSASGVTQVTPIEQLNSKSARIGNSQATPADGELVVSGNVTATTVTAAGIAFQSATTGSGTSGEAFTLDKYETGEWTPSISFGTSGVTGITYNAASTDGIYTRIGNYVFLDFVIKLTSKGSSTGELHIQGFPFTVNNFAAGTSVDFIGGNLMIDASTGIDNGVYCTGHGGLSYGTVRDSPIGALVTEANIADASLIRGNVKYRI